MEGVFFIYCSCMVNGEVVVRSCICLVGEALLHWRWNHETGRVMIFKALELKYKRYLISELMFHHMSALVRLSICY